MNCPICGLPAFCKLEVPVGDGMVLYVHRVNLDKRNDADVLLDMMGDVEHRIESEDLTEDHEDALLEFLQKLADARDLAGGKSQPREDYLLISGCREAANQEGVDAMKTVTLTEYHSGEPVEFTAISEVQHDSLDGLATVTIGQHNLPKGHNSMFPDEDFVNLLEHTSEVIEACARAGWTMPEVVCVGQFCPVGMDEKPMPEQMWEPYYTAAAGGGD